VMADWVVTCSWECSSRWAAESVTKLHPKLSAPGVPHTVTVAVEEPPDETMGGPQLTLT